MTPDLCRTVRYKLLCRTVRLEPKSGFRIWYDPAALEETKKIQKTNPSEKGRLSILLLSFSHLSRSRDNTYNVSFEFKFGQGVDYRLYAVQLQRVSIDSLGLIRASLE